MNQILTCEPLTLAASNIVYNQVGGALHSSLAFDSLYHISCPLKSSTGLCLALHVNFFVSMQIRNQVDTNIPKKA
jgi:hypothetical protein